MRQNRLFITTQNLLEKIVELMKKENLPNPYSLRWLDRVRLTEKTKIVVEVIDYVQTSNIVEDNQLVKCGLLVINQSLGTKKNNKKTPKNKKKEEPFRKRRIESNINELRKDVSLVERWETGMLWKENQKTKLDHLYRVKVKRKGFKLGFKEQLKTYATN